MKSKFDGAVLALVSCALAWAVFFKGGVWPEDWYVSATLIGVCSCTYWTFGRRGAAAPPLNIWISRLLIALPAYVALTLVPLPVSVLSVLSPARAALLRVLQPVIPGLRFAPLTVNAPATVLHLFALLAYVAAFLLIREISFRFRKRPWIPALPLILIGVLEAALGIVQVFAPAGSGFASGTYTNRDHFAGFLEMALPFAFLYGLAIYRRRTGRSAQTKYAVWACLLWSAAIVLFLAIVYSLSRMGFLAAVFVLLLSSIFSVGAGARSSRVRWIVAAGFCLIVAVGAVLLTPDQLAGRFGAAAAKDGSSTEIRAAIWKDTLPLVSEYKLFGCGLGGFESAFAKHQTVANGYTVEFAHNDYVQYLAELGIVGFALMAALAILFALDPLRALFSMADRDRRLLLLACLAALGGMALHSLVDFNSYIPANALAMAWIAGIASANGREQVRRNRSKPGLQSYYQTARKDLETTPHAPAWSEGEPRTLAPAGSSHAIR